MDLPAIVRSQRREGCKIMEHIMLSHIAKHIAKNNIIINEQQSVCFSYFYVTGLLAHAKNYIIFTNMKMIYT